MRARTCVAIFLACVIHSVDNGSRWIGGSDGVDEVLLAGAQLEPRVDRAFAARRFVQRAVWTDGASQLAARPAGTCIETFDVCMDCVRSVAATDRVDPCVRANLRIAF